MFILGLVMQSCSMFSTPESTSKPIKSPIATEMPRPTAKMEVAATQTAMIESLTFESATIFNEGIFAFQIVLNSDSAVFDFDSNKPQETNRELNDITLKMSGGTTVTVAILPLNGASYHPLANNSQLNNSAFSYDQCVQAVDVYRTGGIPIAVGDYFCWLSNEGRLVEFAIRKARQSTDGSFVVEIQYVVWNKTSQ